MYVPVAAALLPAVVARACRSVLFERPGLIRPPAAAMAPGDPPETDETVTPPDPYDRRPVIRLTRPVYRALMTYLGGRPPEAAGAMLGSKGDDLVTRFVPDEWGQATPASFTFGTAELNRAIRPFIALGEDVKGLVHSHPPGCPTPSGGDLGYLHRVFGNPKHGDLHTFLFPIVEGGTLRPYVAVRDQVGGSVRIVEGRLEIVAPVKARPRRPTRARLEVTRIRPLLDTERMAACTVTLVGTGGGANIGRNLTRCNLGRLNLVDFDRVEAVNVCRQEHAADSVGQRKVDALARELGRINPALQVRRFPRNFCAFSDAEIDRHFGDTDLFIFAVDNLEANARGNEVALRLGKPAVWSGLYSGGRAGEIVWWKPGLPCYRCLCGKRYAARDRGEDTGQPAESADIFAVQYLDSVTGMVALGLLTAGADNGYGRLIDQLGDRNFLQLKISPEWAWQGRDIVREHLGVAADCPAYVSWLAIARRDPAGGLPPCPDCQTFRTAR